MPVRIDRSSAPTTTCRPATRRGTRSRWRSNGGCRTATGSPARVQRPSTCLPARISRRWWWPRGGVTGRSTASIWPAVNLGGMTRTSGPHMCPGIAHDSELAQSANGYGEAGQQGGCERGRAPQKRAAGPITVTRREEFREQQLVTVERMVKFLGVPSIGRTTCVFIAVGEIQ